MRSCELMKLKAIQWVFSAQRQVRRGFHLSKAVLINPDNVTEVRIPVPWGHIAGKWWGGVERQPILALHGWQDNAGSWDPLLERLPDTHSVLAIDSPGHGLSSHFPEAMLYHNANYLMALRRLQRHYHWDTGLTVMGHSEGGVFAFLFSVLYPEVVKTLITLDVIKPFAPTSFHMEKLGSKMDKLIAKSRRDSNKNTKYTLTDIENRWLKATRGSLTIDAVRTLMRRGVQLDKESGKYFYTRDPKVKIDSLQRFSEEQSLEMGQNIKCHFLAVRFTQGMFFDDSLKNAPEFINTVTQSAKSFKLVNVEGGHHTHLTDPDRLLPVIPDFLSQVDASDH